MTSDSKKLTIAVSPDMHERLGEMASARGITVTEQIRRAIGTLSTIDMAREIDVEAGGSGDLYIAPANQSDKPIHLLPKIGSI